MKPFRTLLVALAIALATTLSMFAPAVAGASPTTAAATAPATAGRGHAARLVTLERPLAVRSVGADPIPVAGAPRSSAPSIALPATTQFGSARVLLATARKGNWYRVSLPTRPNGSTGWVRARDVSLHTVRDDVRVDLGARTLTWRHDGQVMLESPVAIGAPDTPTPVGSFFVTDLLDNADDTGAYGPYALGLSAHSDTLSEFAGGDGQIGLHGTDAPDSIGLAVSHGCVRVPNDVVTLLAHGLPLGTPVTVV